jgi:hypothetical protein
LAINIRYENGGKQIKISILLYSWLISTRKKKKKSNANKQKICKLAKKNKILILKMTRYTS